jgi:thioredoxin reductase (NADPH)
MAETDNDLVIIGAGPAGLTAGIYAARARMNVLLLEKAVPGGQILVTDWIENYSGFPEGISSKSLIIASGASPRKLGIGEDKFMGKGISFCATCDAPFFKEKTVVAIGGGDTAVQEAVFLTKFASKVYLIHRRDKLRAEKILQERAFENDKIEIIWDSIATGVEGFFGVESVKIKNVKTNEEKTLKADGCFIWVGILPNTSFLNESLKTDETGFIQADKNMQTSVPGVFAVGDVRDTPLRQIATAVGDGAMAAVSAEHFIENL